ncbi:MAG: Nif3-like dinuclear metal center hexameric protein [Halieaceae bacterium]|jgi:dinuclear metal center YbgI/SA1388 family protein|nr:Nif3-like dinuclear metal center hexameric protein [Halieaceae bacterium]
MKVARRELEAAFDRILQPGSFSDYAPNGLQVEGRETISLLVSGVTASQALIDAAVEQGADDILVHHGFFWKGESPVVSGMKRRRLAALLAADVSLFAYHLPLDAHPEYGNNATLGRLLEIEPEGRLRPDDPVGDVGNLEAPQPVSALLQRISERLGRVPLHVGDPDRRVQRIAWCTGAAQGYIEAAVTAGADVFLTGEVSEQTVHVAREEGIEFIAAGHHATERYGVQALGAAISAELGIEHRFIDIDNPA